MSPIELPDFHQLNILKTPAEGLPELIYTSRGLTRAASMLRAGTGPMAVDTEFAQGIRYDGRAFVVQLRRANAGTWLIDAEAVGDLSSLNIALDNVEWVVHSAAQDLLALAKRNMYPGKLFDTEIAVKLLGLKKSSLSMVVEKFLGKKLVKEHQFHDWSRRPLPQAWLNYAALDVELLLPLREILIGFLEDTQREQWAFAESEFIRQTYAQHVLAAREETALEPWRKTSHLSALKTNRQYAIIRELWYERDAIARRKDIYPKRLLDDRTMVSLAQHAPRTMPQFFRVPGIMPQRRQARRWLDALYRAYQLKENALPSLRTKNHKHEPATQTLSPQEKEKATCRVHAAKQRVTEQAAELDIPHENLLSPDIVRKLAWQPPHPLTTPGVKARLEEYGARNWQTRLTASLFVELFIEEHGA